MTQPLHVALVFGTRPEAVKLLPLVRALRHDPRFRASVVVTGQHREMLDEILRPFGIEADVDLQIMQPGQTLNQIVYRIMPRLDELYESLRPDIVVVQGDTTSAFCAALAAFHRRIPVAHVEAGLRSHDRFHPYPEESNRRMVGAVADLHLAPTTRAASCLRDEGVPRGEIVVTGNTVIDSLMMVLEQRRDAELPIRADARLVLVTLHRREAIETEGEAGKSLLDGLLGALRDAAVAHPDVDFVYPVHMNPRVRAPVERVLGGLPNFHLLAPQPYLRFSQMMARATVIVSDSGGVQEEAPSLGIPVLVLRRTTERPEGVEAGCNQLVGTDPAEVKRAIADALAKPRPKPERLPCPNPFGDGRATERTLEAMLAHFGRAPRPSEFGDAKALAELG